MADGDIDALEKLRDKHHNSDTRGDCLDDFITYHIAPSLKIRPSYEDCLRENAVENELIQIEEMSLRDDEEGEKHIQIDAMMIQPSTSESSSETAISHAPPEHSRLSLVTRVSRHVDNFLRKQGASDLQMPILCQNIRPSLWFKAIRATIMNMLIRESDNILFREDDIPPFSSDPEAHAALRDLWTQRLHIEETLDNLLRNPLDIDIDDEFKRLDSAHNVINRQMFKIYQFSTVLVHENNMHRHPPRMMITDPMQIQKYNEETLPSVQSMISDLKESTSTTMAATQESENPTNKDTIEFVSPSKNTIVSVTTGKDATLLDDNREPRNNKRPSHDETDTNKPDNKRSKKNDHASMIQFYAIPGPNSTSPSQQHRDKDPSPNITMMIDSGSSHILVRFEHAHILKYITMSDTKTQPFAKLKSAKIGSELSPIGRGLLQIGPFCFPAFIFRDDELQDSLKDSWILGSFSLYFSCHILMIETISIVSSLSL